MVDSVIAADQTRRHGGNGGIRMGNSSAARQGRPSCLHADNAVPGTGTGNVLADDAMAGSHATAAGSSVP